MTIRIVLVTDDYERAIVKRGHEFFIMTASRGVTYGPFPEKEVAAFTKHGFYDCGAIFWDDEAAKQFLVENYINIHRKERIAAGLPPEPTHKELRELIKYIDINTAIEYLSRIENELIPSGKYDIAKEIAQDLKDVECIQRDPVVLARVEKILEICSNENI